MRLFVLLFLGRKKNIKRARNLQILQRNIKKEYKDDIVLVSLDNRLSELFKPAEKGESVFCHDRGDCREKGLQEKRDSYDAESSASHFGK